MLLDLSTYVTILDPGSYIGGLAAVILKRAPDDGVSEGGAPLEPVDELDGPAKRQAFLLRPEGDEGVATFQVRTSIMQEGTLTNRLTWTVTLSRRATCWDMMFYRPEAQAPDRHFHRMFLPDYDPATRFEEGRTAWDRLLADDDL